MFRFVTTPIKIALGIALGATVLWLILFQAVPRYDQWREQRRLEKLASAASHVANADTLRAAADSEQLIITPTQKAFDEYLRSPQVRSNPVARRVADTSKKIIGSKDKTITDLRGANAHLDSAVKDLESAGPPLPPRLIPYVDAGYGLSSRHRAVPVVRVGLDYRVFKHLSAKLEGSYEPPPAGSEKQTPELRGLIAAHLEFR